MKNKPLDFSSVRVGVIRFLGSNCEMDAFYALKDTVKTKADVVWYEHTNLDGFDALLIPGGFSFGDYLRSGALASRLPIMDSIRQFVAKKKPVLGICNGFQILTEAAILPGALLHNDKGSFVSQDIFISDDLGKTLKMPIAHGEGRYYCDEKTLLRLKNKNAIAYRYSTSGGMTSQESNPNGSIENIAGIWSEDRKVLGLMPHPERAMLSHLSGSSTDGRRVFERFFEEGL